MKPLLLPLLGLLAGALAAAEPARPNIVFILCDDPGINDLHCYGPPQRVSPLIAAGPDDALRGAFPSLAPKSAFSGLTLSDWLLTKVSSGIDLTL